MTAAFWKVEAWSFAIQSGKIEGGPGIGVIGARSILKVLGRGPKGGASCVALALGLKGTTESKVSTCELLENIPGCAASWTWPQGVGCVGDCVIRACLTSRHSPAPTRP